MEANEASLALARLDINDENEIDTLRDAVQFLCQVANPLGKAVDFLKEDAEIMNKEYQFWLKDQKMHQDKLEDERRITEELLQDEVGELIELKEKIEYQQRRIFSIKGEGLLSRT
ncbi:hypothetical protein KP509_07G045600 [Ceratopteris richardii]|uniref:TRAF3-interacting protein 1 C-terminal domain-containing protein n=1 Tax=Ceratopteris richardii TaxID=49495 RepID=A0A8T2U9J9_CERRI|nr:hypothetical protein KP509_07G045600 [Ceratopteris richardii]